MYRCFMVGSIVLLFTACGGSSPSPSPTETVETDDVTMTFFRSFATGTYVFRNQSELADAWAAAPFNGVYPIGMVTSEPTMPAYDYSKNTVLGISLGIGKWCYKPSISDVVRDGQNMIVHYEVSALSTLACLRDGPLISFVLVPRLDGNATFVRDGG